MLKLSSDTLFIHPLPTHLAKRAAPNGQKATPHLIYKRSLQIHVDDQRTKTGRNHISIWCVWEMGILGEWRGWGHIGMAVFDAINDDYKFRLLRAENIPENKETDCKSETPRTKRATTLV